jgi:hypothetical protein
VLYAECVLMQDGDMRVRWCKDAQRQAMCVTAGASLKECIVSTVQYQTMLCKRSVNT